MGEHFAYFFCTISRLFSGASDMALSIRFLPEPGRERWAGQGPDGPLKRRESYGQLDRTMGRTWVRTSSYEGGAHKPFHPIVYSK